MNPDEIDKVIAEYTRFDSVDTYVIDEANVRDIIRCVIAKTCERMRDDIGSNKVAGFGYEQIEFIRLLYLQLGGAVQPTPNEIHRVFATRENTTPIEHALEDLRDEIAKLVAKL